MHSLFDVQGKRGTEYVKSFDSLQMSTTAKNNKK